MRPGRVVVTVLVAGAAACGVAGASIVVPQGSETAGGPDALQPDGGPVVLSSPVADPDGGLPWAVRVYRSKTGQVCPEAGRLKGSDFGTVDQRGQFKALTVEASGSCSELREEPFALAVNSYATSGSDRGRAVVFGTTSSAISEVELRSGAYEDRRAGRGPFVFVLDAATRASATVTFRPALGEPTTISVASAVK